MNNCCSEEEFVRDYAQAIKNSSAAIFIGSGMSRQAGYVGWSDILSDAANDIGLSVEKEKEDLISLAEYYVNSKKSRAKIDEAISKCFSDKKSPTEAHRILASLPITSYWTTNYDKLIENTFSEYNLSYSVLTDDQSFRKFIDGKDRIICKLHGDVENPHEAIITKKDFEEFAYKHEILLAQLKGEMCSKSFLFLGYSFTDTDIKHILTRIRLFYKDDIAKTHYCILEEVTRKKDEAGNYSETEEDFQYRRVKQEHHIVDLMSYGIHTVLVKNYSTDIPDLLMKIRKIVFSKNVFICGAFDNDYVNAKCVSQYAKTLSAWLITNGYHIISGYGKNIGEQVVSGAYEGYSMLRGNYAKDFGSQVSISPFPYRSSWTAEEKDKIYTLIREKMIANAGICIVINGTKKYRRKTINAEGVKKEAEIALKNGALVIPIAATNGAARDVWDEMMYSNNEYVKSPEFKMLRDGTDFDQVYTSVQKIIEKYNK